MTRKARRGGKKSKQDRLERFRKCLAAPLQLKHMIGEKKHKCWQRFCEEHGYKDPREIVRWVKDLWRLKTGMRRLKTKEGRELMTEQEKVQGWVQDLFGWDEDSQPTTTTIHDERLNETVDGEKKIMIKQVRKALNGTLNA